MCWIWNKETKKEKKKTYITIWRSDRWRNCVDIDRNLTTATQYRAIVCCKINEIQNQSKIIKKKELEIITIVMSVEERKRSIEQRCNIAVCSRTKCQQILFAIVIFNKTIFVKILFFFLLREHSDRQESVLNCLQFNREKKKRWIYEMINNVYSFTDDVRIRLLLTH